MDTVALKESEIKIFKREDRYSLSHCEGCQSNSLQKFSGMTCFWKGSAFDKVSKETMNQLFADSRTQHIPGNGEMKCNYLEIIWVCTDCGAVHEFWVKDADYF